MSAEDAPPTRRNREIDRNSVAAPGEEPPLQTLAALRTIVATLRRMPLGARAVMLVAVAPVLILTYFGLETISASVGTWTARTVGSSILGALLAVFMLGTHGRALVLHLLLAMLDRLHARPKRMPRLHRWAIVTLTILGFAVVVLSTLLLLTFFGKTKG